MRDPARAALVAKAFAAVGTIVVLSSTLYGGTGWAGVAAFFLWGLVPWGVLWLAGRFVPYPWWTGGAGAVALAAELGVRASVFVFPAGSTAALALLVSPAGITLLLLPGALLGAGGDLLWRRGGLLPRALVVALGTSLLGLLVLGLARPDLMPTTVLRRRAMLERIGEPRVAAGAERFESVGVSGPGVWFGADPLSGSPGDDVVIVEGDVVRLLDPAGFAERQRLTIGLQALGGWGWSSRLARLGDRVVVVQTGGGFQPTELRELDGRPVWTHQPDPSLPPDGMHPADLDGNGGLEFYAVGQSGLTCLDASGKVVWTQPDAVGGIPAMLPAADGTPAWIVTTSGGRVRVLDEEGALVGEHALPDGRGVVGAVDLAPHGRLLVTSGAAGIQGGHLDGRVVVDIPVEDFVATQAMSVTFAPGGADVLAVALSPRDSSVERARLVLADARGAILYDEVLAGPARLLVARRADGGETLLVAEGGLRALRPR